MCCLLAGTSIYADLQPLDHFTNKAEFWGTSPDEFQAANQSSGFRWTSETKQTSRSDGQRIKLSLFEMPVGETIVAFTDNAPQAYQISIFARGDDGAVSKEKFEEVIEQWKAILTKFTQNSPQDVDSRGVVDIKGFIGIKKQSTTS